MLDGIWRSSLNFRDKKLSNVARVETKLELLYSNPLIRFIKTSNDIIFLGRPLAILAFSSFSFIINIIPSCSVDSCNKVQRVRMFQVSLFPHSSSELVMC